MKVGDLVMIMAGDQGVGVIVEFDGDGDPRVYECGSGKVLAHYTHHIEVIG
jgi:hypothetical protein